MKIKICGLRTPQTVQAAIEAGADFIGFVFYEPSPRHLDLETARYLRLYVPGTVKIVALVVDADDTAIEKIIAAARPAMLQLHGNETPERAAALKEKFGLPLIKAFRISSPADLDLVESYTNSCDWCLFDAKPLDAKLPGGTGRSFDWTLLQHKVFSRPWMLSGGLNEDNLPHALSILKPDAVDVSSGVESAPGEKDERKIAGFIDAARRL